MTPFAPNSSNISLYGNIAATITVPCGLALDVLLIFLLRYTRTQLFYNIPYAFFVSNIYYFFVYASEGIPYGICIPILCVE